MSEYIVIAENITFKKGKLSCINFYNEFTTFAMPAEFVFDIAILCGPNWSVGEHNLTVKLFASNGKELELGKVKFNIPNEDFVYNAFLTDISIQMDDSVSNLKFVIYEEGKEILSRTMPVRPMFKLQQTPPNSSQNEQTQDERDENKKDKKDKKKKD